LKTPKINYIYGYKGMLDEIKPLWEALNEHHRQHSQNFKKHYSEMTFEKRKPDLLTKVARIKMRVDLAVDAATGQNVGYCVSSFDKEKTGEIESIFVNVVYRGLGNWRFTDEKSTQLDGGGRCSGKNR
jgi:diamine N-acetyltransferase